MHGGGDRIKAAARALGGGGGSLGSEELQERSTKRSTRMYEKVHRTYKKVHIIQISISIQYRGSEQALQLGHACSKITKIIQRKVHFFVCKEPTRRIPWLRS